MKTPKKCVRLTCVICWREDWDGITPKQLKELVKARAIRDLFETQTWEEATDLTKNLDMWETHHCECRECIIEMCGDEFEESDMDSTEEMLRRDRVEAIGKQRALF